MGLPGHRRTSTEGKLREKAMQMKKRSLTRCPECQTAMQLHHACPKCGAYRGKK